MNLRTQTSDGGAICTARQLLEQLRELGLEGEALDDAFFELARLSGNVRLVGPAAGLLASHPSTLH